MHTRPASPTLAELFRAAHEQASEVEGYARQVDTCDDRWRALGERLERIEAQLTAVLERHAEERGRAHVQLRVWQVAAWSAPIVVVLVDLTLRLSGVLR